MATSSDGSAASSRCGTHVSRRSDGNAVKSVAHASAAGAAALPQRLAQILVKDPAVLLYHAEVVFRDGVAVGEVRGKAHQHERGCTHAKPHTHAHHHAHPHAHMRR